MRLIDEFKAFAMRGNVVDMAVGIIIGAAFGKIVSSIVSDIIMPPIGLLIGGVNFTDLSITLKAAVDGSDAVLINYGNFIQVVFDFLIVAIAIFTVIKGMNT
ncbi:MAG: large-conductance mechanosensitive channel protein MscL, partial [Bacteroidales bacterium]|nr:large-conductance mechanosensitive channel protein MscL [Bacteroidales bacterium]